jgi:hypothetical protein
VPDTTFVTLFAAWLSADPLSIHTKDTASVEKSCTQAFDAVRRIPVSIAALAGVYSS